MSMEMRQDDKNRTGKIQNRYGGKHDQDMGQNGFIQRAKVLWCCGELALDFDRVDFGGNLAGIKKSLIST